MRRPALLNRALCWAVLALLVAIPALAGAQASPQPASITTSLFLPLTMKDVPAEPLGLEEQVIVQLTNEYRAANGCDSTLRISTALMRAAQAHSLDMAATSTISHLGSDGSGPAERATRAGYVWTQVGENVAAGYTTSDAVMAAWQGSADHRANIVSCSFVDIGVGVAVSGDGTIYWTQIFATP